MIIAHFEYELFLNLYAIPLLKFHLGFIHNMKPLLFFFQQYINWTEITVLTRIMRAFFSSKTLVTEKKGSALHSGYVRQLYGAVHAFIKSLNTTRR